MRSQVIDRYKLVEVLGEGPRATVYKARDSKGEAWAALKLFHTSDIENPDKLLRLRHSHIATILNVGRWEAQSFAVTEYLSGGNLKDHIRSMQSVGSFLPADQVLAYSRQIAEALVYASDHQVAHGGLKAENVMFSDNGTLKLTDFNASTLSDLEALGKLLYEMATGRLPLSGIDVPPIEAFRNDLPAAFRELVTRLLDRDRADRYEDVRAVLKDLEASSTLHIPSHLRTTMARGATAPTAPALSVGRLLSGRFRIVRFIARGGMGDVYEAEDLELHDRVALKTVRPDIAGAPFATERFQREIQLARKVTHANVCRIFDLFRDTAGTENVTFLTMELLEGETLLERLLRAGKLSPGEALPIITQMAAGLAAAHKAGIIHRDFKSSNVMLIPTESDEEELRAVVTDFGLARPALVNESMATTLSNFGDAVGTPAYMAPEQLESGELTPATDIYAFGIVMYEMIAGKLPWTGDSGLGVALQRLQGPPPSPRSHVPDLDTVWETTILRCLQRKPADRPGNINEVVSALAGESVVVPFRAGRRRLSAILSLALVLAVVLAIVAGALVNRNRETPADFKARRSIAVLGFRNLTGQSDAAWLSTALPEMLTTELAAGEKLRTIPGENVARMEVELSLPESGSFGADTLARIRNYLGVDVIVYGSYVVLSGAPSRVRMDLRLQDSLQGNLLATISEEGYAADLLTLVSRSGAALREKLGVGKLQPGEAEAVQAALPKTPEAARFYADGLERLRVFDAFKARDSFENAIAEDGRNALARAALATAWSMLGYPIRAREQSRIALDLSAGLGREDRLVVEGRAREAALEWPKAVEVYRILFGFFPDNFDYGLRLAEAQTSAGQAKDGLTTVAKLRRFPPPDGDSPRIDLAEARAAGALSDFKHQQEMAARAAEKGQERGTKLLVSGAKLLEGSAFANLGDFGRARAAFEAAREMYIATGDRWDAANASANLAYVDLQSGDLGRAEQIYEQSLATYRELGDRKGEAAALTSLGTVSRNRGDLPHARERHEQALSIRREIGDRIGEAMSLNNLANLLSLMGNSQAARTMYQSALAVFREVGDRNAVATVLSNLGDLVSEEGDLARARELYEESRATFQSLGNQSSLAHELSRLGDLDLINADLASAREKYTEALALRKQLGDKPGIGESQLALAQIALHEGDAVSAEAAAKAAAAQFADVNRVDDEASAVAVVARSLLLRGNNAGSLAAIQRAEELSMKSDDRGVRLAVAITGASLRAARGDASRSLRDLESVIQEARTARLVQLELEARLALAEIEIATGRLQTGRLRLDALAAEAAQRGYKFIADRAAAARKKIPALAA